MFCPREKTLKTPKLLQASENDKRNIRNVPRIFLMPFNEKKTVKERFVRGIRLKTNSIPQMLLLLSNAITHNQFMQGCFDRCLHEKSYKDSED